MLVPIIAEVIFDSGLRTKNLTYHRVRTEMAENRAVGVGRGKSCKDTKRF